MSQKKRITTLIPLFLVLFLSACSSSKHGTKTSVDSERLLKSAQAMVEQGDYKAAGKLLEKVNPKKLAVRDRYLHEQLLAQLGQPLVIRKALPHPKMSVFFEPSDLAKGIKSSSSYYLQNGSCERCDNKYYMAELELTNTSNLDYSFKMECLVHVFRRGKLNNSGFFDLDYNAQYRLSKQFGLKHGSQLNQKLIFDKAVHISDSQLAYWYDELWSKDIFNQPYCRITALRFDTPHERNQIDIIKARINKSINHCHGDVALQSVNSMDRIAVIGNKVTNFHLFWIKDFSFDVQGGVNSVSKLDRLNGIHSRAFYTVTFNGRYYRSKLRVEVLGEPVYGDHGTSKKWTKWKGYQNEISQIYVNIINGKIQEPDEILSIKPLACHQLPVK